MAKAPIRIDQKDITSGTALAIPTGHADALHLNPNQYIPLKNGEIDYTKYLAPSPYSGGGATDPKNPGDGNPPDPGMGDDNTLPPDIPSLSAIESVVYEQYYDETTKGQKVRAIIKIKNTAQVPTNTTGIDARIYNPATQTTSVTTTASSGSSSKVAFVTPTPSVPSVVFKRDGNTLSWGWNNSNGLGSYSSVSYQWTISTTNSPSATALDSGTETYTTGNNLQIGTSSYYKQYRVSSRNGDTTATSSPRWLRVRCVVVGTNGTTYTSAYSTPI